jgi:hypothetical protein
MIPGTHNSVLKEPHVQGLAAALKKCLLQYSEQAPGKKDSGAESPTVSPH